MGTMSPLRPSQPGAVTGAVALPPSWMTATITSAPCARSTGISALAVSASSAKRNPATPLGVTMVGVVRSVRPIKPTVMVAPFSVKRLSPVAGSRVWPTARKVLAVRMGKRAPANGWLS